MKIRKSQKMRDSNKSQSIQYKLIVFNRRRVKRIWKTLPIACQKHDVFMTLIPKSTRLPKKKIQTCLSVVKNFLGASIFFLMILRIKTR